MTKTYGFKTSIIIMDSKETPMYIIDTKDGNMNIEYTKLIFPEAFDKNDSPLI